LAVPVESGFTQQLESLLQVELKDRRVEVINLAVSGIGPAQYLRMLERRGLGYTPDLVLMAVYPENDFWDSYYDLSGGPSKAFYAVKTDGSLQYIAPESSKITVKMRPYLRKSAFLNLLRQGLTLTSLESRLGQLGVLQAPGVAHAHSMDWGVYNAALPDPWTDAYRTTLRTIAASHDVAKQHGAGFLAMTIGSVAMVEDRWDELFANYPAAKTMALDSHRPFSAIGDLGEQQGFSVINLAEPFRQDFLAHQKSRSWPHDGHWNLSGHRFAAEIVARHLLAHKYRYTLSN
jgi:hypothetical protein